MLGKERLGGYFARRGFFVWTYDRQPGDEQWLRSVLSKPDEVKENRDGHLRAHVVTQDDMRHLHTSTRRLLVAAAGHPDYDGPEIPGRPNMTRQR